MQVFQVLRFVSFLIISIVFTKSTLSLKDIGDFELLLFIASAISFFWVTGIIQSLLPLFNNNNSYPYRKNHSRQKSPEIFNAFILLLFFSILLALIGFFVQKNIQVYKGGEELPYANYLLLYTLFSNPACLVEYIYLLYNKARKIINIWLLDFHFAGNLCYISGNIRLWRKGRHLGTYVCDPHKIYMANCTY